MTIEQPGKISAEDFVASAIAQDIRSLDDILKQVKLPAAHRMLDLGCGYGGFTKYVASRLKNPDIHGIDLDSGQL